MCLELRKVLMLVFTFVLCACTFERGSEATGVPDDRQVERGVAWVDFDSTQIFVKESFPMQVELILQGDLPTPCHELKWEISDPDENKAIHLEVYSEVESGAKCAQMLEPFKQRIPLGEFEDTGYSVWINDYKVGEF